MSFCIVQVFGINFGFRNDRKIVITGQKYMGNRKVTHSTLRALSVIGVMKQDNQDAIQIDAYHNPFATIPVEPKLLCGLATEQFIHPNPHGKSIVNWEPIRIEI